MYNLPLAFIPLPLYWTDNIHMQIILKANSLIGNCGNSNFVKAPPSSTRLYFSIYLPSLPQTTFHIHWLVSMPGWLLLPEHTLTSGACLVHRGWICLRVFFLLSHSHGFVLCADSACEWDSAFLLQLTDGSKWRNFQAACNTLTLIQLWQHRLTSTLFSPVLSCAVFALVSQR